MKKYPVQAEFECNKCDMTVHVRCFSDELSAYIEYFVNHVHANPIQLRSTFDEKD